MLDKDVLQNLGLDEEFEHFLNTRLPTPDSCVVFFFVYQIPLVQVATNQPTAAPGFYPPPGTSLGLYRQHLGVGKKFPKGGKICWCWWSRHWKGIHTVDGLNPKQPPGDDEKTLISKWDSHHPWWCRILGLINSITVLPPICIAWFSLKIIDLYKGNPSNITLDL